MKTFHISLVVSSVLALLAVSSGVQADVMGVNFDYNTNRQGYALNADDTAGAVAVQNNWNNLANTFGMIDGGIQTWTAGTLMDGNGASTSVGLIASTTNLGDAGGDPDALWGQGGAWSGSTGSEKLFAGGLQIRGATVTVNLTNLDSFTGASPFDLYVYFSAGSDVGGNGVSTTVTAGAASTSLLPAGYTGTYRDGTGDVAGNYVKFAGLTGDSLTLITKATADWTDPHTNVAGLQIVTVPEPGTLALLAFGSWIVRHHQRKNRPAKK